MRSPTVKARGPMASVEKWEVDADGGKSNDKASSHGRITLFSKKQLLLWHRTAGTKNKRLAERMEH